MPLVDLLRKIHNMLFIINIESNLSLVLINDSTRGVDKRSSKNYGHAPVLGHKISERGIEVDITNIEAVGKMPHLLDICARCNNKVDYYLYSCS